MTRQAVSAEAQDYIHNGVLKTLYIVVLMVRLKSVK